MLYGDLQIFDIIIFAGIAAFLVFRLKNVLGKRTGFEKKNNPNIDQQAFQNKPELKTPNLPESLNELKKAYEVLKNFDHNRFLDGAKIAFETITNAFNSGDKKTLKNLLTKDVFKSFESAIDNKQTEQDWQFYSLAVEKVESVKHNSTHINISVSFISEQFKNNDENTITKKQDTWTFQKPINADDPKWLLAST